MSFTITIEHQCPQCGAPIILQETDRLFQCDYCRVNSFIVPRGHFRYLFPSKASEGKTLFYFPFWRFKGMHFSYGPGGVQHRFVDFSHQAIRESVFPVSVGLRSQALKLKFVSSEINGRLLRPLLSFNQVMDIFNRRFTASLPQPILHQSHIGESLSLVYSPFYMDSDSKLYDAVLNRAIPSDLPESFDLEHFSHDQPGGHVRFLPTLCPNCGWDLKGERDALLLSCNNCQTMWRGASAGLKQVRFAHLPGEKDDRVFYLPFWRIRADISGIHLKSYADLVKAANLPKVIQSGWEDMGFRFWVPAFKVRPRTFLRLANNLTLAQPREKPDDALPKNSMYPVTLPVKEAIESLKITLASFIKPKEFVHSNLPDIQIRPERYILVYLPFVESHHDFVWEKYRISVNKNQLKLSSNL